MTWRFPVIRGLPEISKLPMIWVQVMRAPARVPVAGRRFGVVTAIDDFVPLEFPWCSAPTQASPRARLRSVTLAGNLLVVGGLEGDAGYWF